MLHEYRIADKLRNRPVDDSELTLLPIYDLFGIKSLNAVKMRVHFWLLALLSWLRYARLFHAVGRVVDLDEFLDEDLGRVSGVGPCVESSVRASV